MRIFWKAYEIVYISSLDITARFTNYTGQLNKVPGSVPEKTENTYFWNPIWKIHNFKTTGPNDPKFELQLVHKVYNIVDLDKSSIKPSYHPAKVRLLSCCPEQLINP